MERRAREHHQSPIIGLADRPLVPVHNRDNMLIQIDDTEVSADLKSTVGPRVLLYSYRWLRPAHSGASPSNSGPAHRRLGSPENWNLPMSVHLELYHIFILYI